MTLAEPVHHFESRVNKDKLAKEGRIAAYVVANGYLSLHAILGENLQMSPTKLLIYLTIVTAAVQRVIRSGSLPDHLRGVEVLPLEHTGYISRRALAAATGVSRETVRRAVSEMLEEGLLIVGTQGRVAAKPGILGKPHIQNCVNALLKEMASISNRLHRLEVFQSTLCQASPSLPAHQRDQIAHKDFR